MTSSQKTNGHLSSQLQGGKGVHSFVSQRANDAQWKVVWMVLECDLPSVTDLSIF